MALTAFVRRCGGRYSPISIWSTRATLPGAGMVEEAALAPSTHTAIFHRFGWGLLDRRHILGYPVPGAFDDLTPGRRRFSFVWYRPVDVGMTLAEMQTDATGRVHSEGIPPQLIRPEVIAALRRDAEAMLPPVFAEIVRTCAQPLFQPIGDLEITNDAPWARGASRGRRVRRTATRCDGSDQGGPRRH